MSSPMDQEFLSIATHTFTSDEESTPSPIQPHIDTLFAEFARNRPRLISPRSSIAAGLDRLVRNGYERVPREAVLQMDLRALEYLSDYDSHLMCPICHVPFIDPLVLDCDHTFCAACFEEYREAVATSERSLCPTCRHYILSNPRKASRLIINMCNDIKVRCPNEDCEKTLPRGCVEQHATKDCADGLLECPESSCAKLVKRKNFVPGQCIHSSHIECDCGAFIVLGRGEWLKHKDEDCPTTGVKCDRCNERISVKDYLAGRNAHVCKDEEAQATCPGAEYGCNEDVDPEDIENHVQECIFARLVPHLSKQSKVVESLQEQLVVTKTRNEILESGIDKLHAILHDQVFPKLLDHVRSSSAVDTDIEEIDRENHPIPSATGHRDLLLPAHLRALTPSPSPSQTQSQSHAHILALHESLRTTVSTLENDLTTLSHSLADLDARTSMQLMNETLRIKEDLAHTNAALFSTRAQVQWFLNRERVGQQQQQHQLNMLRGRTPSSAAQRQDSASSTTNTTQVHSPPDQQQQAHPSTPSSSSSLAQHWSSSMHSDSGLGEGLVGAFNSSSIGETQLWTSASTSASGTSPRARPVIRRPSGGGSQERVKL